MNLHVFFKHMDQAPALYAYVETRLRDRLDRYALGTTEAHMTFAVENGTNTASCHIHGNRLAIQAKSVDSQSMYRAVDLLIDKLDEILRRQKERRRSHRIRMPIDIAPIASDI